MRKINNHNAAAPASPKPFAGLGFAMETVQVVAQEMSAIYTHCEFECGSFLSMPETVVQPSGYSLLVTLGREIRGR